ncbi:hypothetical protein ACFQMA_02760 [Halosimplex aquaticum]|uniref:Pectate lyase n=1 Tax=Halosimplex aquaticum TaxID=3026162 RepID=A0ABD5XUJ3_9EURY|nr:hypothetical protein [Halosimplex aquaticum]
MIYQSGGDPFLGASSAADDGRSTAGSRSANTAAETPRRDDERLSTVESYVDRVLETGRDRWSGESTPLFVDGVHVETDDPVTWRYDGEEFVVSNLASQQNLFRVLAGLSGVTGDRRYVDAARESVAYHFDELVDERGLLRWGGHQFVDLRTLDPVGHFDADVHEFKTHFPFYELLWDVDAEATTRLLRAVWDAHVLDWETLDMNRHGEYGRELGDLWDHEFADPDPFFEGDGLSFVNVGTDLILAAGALSALAGDGDAWTWGERLAEMYVKARHPETGLGAYQYTKPRRRNEPPADGPLPTTSDYGDRAENQFGDEFAEVAREGWVVWGSRVRTLYARSGFVQLALAESLGRDGEQLRRWTVDGLAVLAEHGYAPERNAFLPMWADGTDLTGKSFPRTGYYGEKGRTWEPLDADMQFLRTYVRAYRLSGRDVLWETARRIADGLGVGDIGANPGEGVALDPEVAGANPMEIFALLELQRTASHPDYLDRARRVADRMIERRYHHGFFLASADRAYARFDAAEPLAILALDAALRGKPGLVPEYLGGHGYVHGTFDGHGRTRDTKLIWPAERGEEPGSR